MIHDPFTAAIRAAVEPMAEELRAMRAELADLRETLADKVPDPERFWSYKDVAKKCGVTRGAVAIWVHRGLIEKAVIDEKPCIPDSEVRRLIKNACRPSYTRAAK